MLTNTRYWLHVPPLRKFHATSVYSDKLQASVRLGWLPTAKVKATTSRPSQLKVKKAWKRNEGKKRKNEPFPTSTRLSSLLRRHNKKIQHQHTVGGESTFPRSLDLAKSKGKLSSTTKRVAHPRTSEDDTTGGSPYFSKLCLFIRLPRTANFGWRR